MLNVTRLREFLLEVKAAISDINFTQTVVDDSELTKFLNERKTSDNNFLIAILPQFGITGTEDGIKWDNQLMFMILRKGADKDFKNHDEYMNEFALTQTVVKNFIEYIITQKTQGNGDLCGLLSDLKESSIIILPVWKKTGCNGWQIQIDLLSRF